MTEELTSSEMTDIDEILKSSTLSKNINKRYNVKEEVLNNVNNVDPSKNKLLNELLQTYEDKPKGVAEIIAGELDDLRNINFYIKVAKNNNLQLLFEALSITKEALKEGKIRTSGAKYYVGVLKRMHLRW